MDPQQQQQAANMMAGMGAGVLGFAFLFFFAIIAFVIWLFWRIFTKAGLAGPLSLLILVPGVGGIIVVCILAFSKWNVVPVPPGYATDSLSYPPAYPPPPTYPPAGPPSQL